MRSLVIRDRDNPEIQRAALHKWGLFYRKQLRGGAGFAAFRAVWHDKQSGKVADPAWTPYNLARSSNN
jgi:hypothetical protein